MKKILAIASITTGIATLSVTAQQSNLTQGAENQQDSSAPRSPAHDSEKGATGDSRATRESGVSDATQRTDTDTAMDAASAPGAPATQSKGAGEAAASVTAWTKKLDPQMRAVLDELQVLGGKPLHSLSAEEARSQPAFADALKAIAGRDKAMRPESGETQEVDIKLSTVDLKGRVYRPDGDGPFPVILYVHGGGWVVGSLDSYDATPRALCKATGALVISTHYRQAPEHKFPTSHNDVYGSYQWAMANAGRWGGNGKKVAIVGESAGGNMAAAATVMAREEGKQMPVHQVLIYPIASTTMDTESYQQFKDAKPLDAVTMKWFFDQSLGQPSDATDPKVALLQEKNFQGLPATTIITAEIDPLCSEGEALAQNYEKGGVAVTYKNYKGVTHEFVGTAAVVDKAQEAIDFIAAQLKKSFEMGGASSGQAGTTTPAPTGGTDVSTAVDAGTPTATRSTGTDSAVQGTPQGARSNQPTGGTGNP